MSRLSNVPREAKLLAAALLLLKGYKQTDIAKALGVTEPTITHWIQGGRDRYWRVGAKRVGPALEAASPALKRQAQSLMHRPAVSTPELMRLAGAPRRHVLSVDVAPTHWDECRNRARRKLGTADAADNAWRAWLAEFAGFAAPRVRDLMATGKTWGVTSGCQVDAVIDAIAALHVRPRRAVISIPLCGNPVDAHALADSSTHLAVRLERALTRRVLKPLSLALVPALIPGHLDRTSVATIWDYIAASSPAYCRIFGTDHLPPGLGFAAPPSLHRARLPPGVALPTPPRTPARPARTPGPFPPGPATRGGDRDPRDPQLGAVL